MGDISVLIVEDHLLLAEGVRAALADAAIDVVAIGQTGAEAVALARQHHPDVILLDLMLPDADGMDVGREILRADPDTKILVLTGLEAEEIIAEAMESGFHGVLYKDADTSLLVGCLRLVAQGTSVLPHVAAREIASTPPGGSASGSSLRLTRRQREVLSWLATGAGTAEIAKQLYLSPNTVRTHIQNIMSKMGVRSRLEAAAYALEHRLVPRRHRRRQRLG